MKNNFLKIILLFTLVNTTYGQTCFDKLRIHMGDANVSTEFKNFIKNDPDGLYVFQKLAYSSEAIRTDLNVLNFYKKLATNNIDVLGTKLINKLNDAEIIEFSNKYKNLSKADLEKFVANDEFIDVWKKWKDRNVTSLEDITAYQKIWKLEIRNVSFDDFYFKTRYQIKDANNPVKFAQEVFEAWKKGVGHEVDIQNVYTKYGLKINKDYPPCEGIWGIIKTDAPNVNDVFDRFQEGANIGGSYAGVCPTNYSYTVSSRALKENYTNIVANSQDYFYFKFKFKFKNTYTSNLEYGEAIPWFGKDGGAIQVKTPNKLNDISNQLEIVEKWKLENENWVQVLGSTNSVLKTNLLTKFNNFSEIKTFINGLDDITDVNLLNKLDNFDTNYYARLNTDLVHPNYGSDIKELLKENPDDLTEIWKRLKDDPAFSWELQKTGGSRWDKWSQREFFKDITAKGKGFETDVCLVTFKNRNSAKYLELKQKFQADFSKNLDDYDMYSQVQLKYDDDNYFVADQLFVKRNLDGDIVDMVVIENKLSNTTPLTTPQSTAYTKTSFTVRSVNIESATTPGKFLSSGQSLNFSGTKQWYKVHDGANGDVISGINKMN